MSHERETLIREYKAIVWADCPDAIGQRVTVWARSLEEAAETIRAEYGADCVMSLWNEQAVDARR